MGLLNIMPGETYGIPDNTQNPSLLDNPALQMGLSILANNQGNYGSFGAAIGKGGLQGIQGIQRQQEAMRQQKLMDRYIDNFIELKCHQLPIHICKATKSIFSIRLQSNKKIKDLIRGFRICFNQFISV